MGVGELRRAETLGVASGVAVSVSLTLDEEGSGVVLNLEVVISGLRSVVRFHHLRLLHQGKRASLPASSAFKDLLSAKNESVRTMISPESVMMATRQMRSDEDSTSFGLFEVPDVSTPPLSPLPALSCEQPLASASTPVDIPSAPAPYDADLFYNSEVPVCIDYGQTEKAACTITEADESVDYLTEADASLGYTTVTDEACSSSSSSSTFFSSSSSSNNNNNNNTAANAKEDEQQTEMQKTELQTILRLTVGKEIVEKNLHWELFRQQQHLTDEELARQLQEQWEAEDRFINRSKDSDNPYSLRNGTRKKTEKSYAKKATPTEKKTSSGKVRKTRMMQNQKTIKEAFARTKAMNK